MIPEVSRCRRTTLEISMSNATGPASSPRTLVPEVEAAGISVVVPLYNESGNLRPLVDELVPVMESIGKPFEIIFVNDGSTDGSATVLRSLRAEDRRVRVLTFERNAGQTAAMSAGFEAARGEVVVTLDADLQNDPNDIPRLLERMADHDAVVGWRARRRDTWLRRVSSRIANAVRN